MHAISTLPSKSWHLTMAALSPTGTSLKQNTSNFSENDPKGQQTFLFPQKFQTSYQRILSM